MKVLKPTMKVLKPTQVWQLGDAWAGSTANVVPFRGSAFLLELDGSHLTAFYDADGAIVLHRAAYGLPETQSARIANTILPFDAHKSISMGRDGFGRVWLAFGAHSGNLFLTRSLSSDALAGFGEVREVATKMTYPIFLAPDETTGGIHLLVRLGSASKGDLVVFQVSPGIQDWLHAGLPLIAGQTNQPWTAGPYTNRPVKGIDGRWYLFLVWRLPATAVFGNPAVNVGVDLVCVRDFSPVWKQMQASRSQFRRVKPPSIVASRSGQEGN